MAIILVAKYTVKVTIIADETIRLIEEWLTETGVEIINTLT